MHNYSTVNACIYQIITYVVVQTIQVCFRSLLSTLHFPPLLVFWGGVQQVWQHVYSKHIKFLCWTLIFWKFQLELNTFEHETHKPEWKHPLPTQSRRYLDLLEVATWKTKKVLLLSHKRRKLLEIMGVKKIGFSCWEIKLGVRV